MYVKMLLTCRKPWVYEAQFFLKPTKSITYRVQNQTLTFFFGVWDSFAWGIEHHVTPPPYGTAERLGGLENGKTANETQFFPDFCIHFQRRYFVFLVCLLLLLQNLKWFGFSVLKNNASPQHLARARARARRRSAPEAPEACRLPGPPLSLL